jgi:hypothetical protein
MIILRRVIGMHVSSFSLLAGAFAWTNCTMSAGLLRFIIYPVAKPLD